MSPIGCNCGKKNTLSPTFVYTNEKGEQREYKTLLEAQAAWIRNKKQGSVREEKPVRA